MWTAENRARYDRSGLRYPSDLTDDEWAHVAPLIPPAKRGGMTPPAAQASAARLASPVGSARQAKGREWPAPPAARKCPGRISSDVSAGGAASSRCPAGRFGRRQGSAAR